MAVVSISPDWSHQWFTAPGELGLNDLGFKEFLFLMVLSAVTGLFASFLYRIFFRSRATGSELHRAFPLISLSVTAIFLCIQFSLPLSLGLLGALSIVRFRTPVKEPEEIGFLMLVIATALCCATFNLMFLGAILVVALGVLLLLNWRRGLIFGNRSDGLLVLTMPRGAYVEGGLKLLALLDTQLKHGRLDALTEGQDEVVVSYAFPKLERSQLPELQGAWRELVSDLRADIYFSRGEQG